MGNLYNLLRSSIQIGSFSEIAGKSIQSKKSNTFFGFLAISLMVLFFQNSFSQSAGNYAFSTGSSGSLALDMIGNNVDMSSGTTQLVGPGLDATASAVTNIGFNFYLMGSKYTQFSVQEDGIIQLGSAVVSTNTYTISGGTATAPRLSAFNADFRTGTTTGKIHYKMVGTTPNRVLVVEFVDMQLFYTTAAAGTSTWQMRLYENGTLEAVYGTMSVTNVSASSRAPSIGFYTGAATGNFVSVNHTAHTSSIVAPYTANPNIAAVGPIASIDTPANGSRRTYSLTPLSATPSDAITMTFTAVTSGNTTVNWIDNSTNETLFVVTRALDAGFTAGVVNTTVSSTSMLTTGTGYSSVQTGLTPSTLYYYKVAAATEGGIPSSGLLGSTSTTAPGTFTSIVTGNWSSPSTWDIGIVPSPFDSAVISTGNIVTLDLAGLAINNLDVSGTLNYGATPTTFAVNGNLTVNVGGAVNVFNATTGKTLTVTGNITNNGTMDISVGITTGGNLTLNGTAVQTVNGSGTFVTSVIRNLTFSNTNASIPNIIWSFNDIKIANNLNLTGARINMGTNKMTFGNNAVGGTLTAPVGTGFLTGAKFSRWWTTAATGTAITAGTDPTNTTSRYPFINASGANRAMYITRSSGTVTGNTAGELAVVYTDGTGMTTGLSIADGAYTINDRYNGKWAVTAEAGYVYVSGTHTAVLIAQNAYTAANGNSRIMTDLAAIAGTHQNGTTTPSAQRTGLTTADLTTATGLYMGINSADVPFTSIATGSWDSAAIWNKGTIPTCTDAVVIANATVVTVASAGNVAKNVTVAVGGTMVQSSGDLTVGCTLKNNTFTNNGTFNVSGGTLNVNGNVLIALGSTFNQSGGAIIEDGNDNGIVANSVATGTTLFRINTSTVSLTGGQITIVDPHVGTSTSDYSFGYGVTSHANATTAHTVNIGNGVSMDVTTNTGGYIVDPYISTARLNLGNLVLNSAVANRIVTLPEGLGIHGNLTINAGNELRATGSFLFVIGGNVLNNGTLTASITNFALGSPSPTSVAAVSNVNPQSVSGSGVFRNSASAVTANLANLIVDNTNATGVTFNVPISVSGTLTLINAKLNTTAANLLTLGTATAAGTLVGGSATAYVNGPFARTFGVRASAATYDQTTLFPVGKGTVYLPINMAPTTTLAGVKLMAETFTSNSGTYPSIYSSLGANRWEASVIAGGANLTDVFVRENDAAIAINDEILQSASAAGLYNAIIPASVNVPGASLATATAIAAANFTGFFSYGKKCTTAAPTGTAAQTFCNAATVADLTATGTGIQWYAAATGGTVLASTTALVNGVHYFASQTSTCESPTRFDVTATVNVTAVPTGTAAQTFCNAGTVANLVATGSGIQWYAAPTGGAPLASTVTLVDAVHYFASQTVSGCESATRFDVTVTVNSTSQPTGSASQTFCNAGTVANLVAAGTGVQWYAAAIGGSPLASTTVLVDGAHYFASQTVSGCESATRLDVTVTVSNTPAPTGAASQTFVTGQMLSDIVVSGSNIVWYASSADASVAANPLPNSTLLVDTTTYYATQTIAGCAGTSSLAVTITVNLGVNEFDSSSFAFYPNPVKNVLNFSYSKDMTDVAIFNIMGQQVFASRINATTAQIDMSGLSNGTYFVKVSSDNATKTIKVIKK
ncbi:S-layer family protein [Flavobacterium sp. GT3R68]|uniref:beta strand repeat-containing protein n=1 Tax=Flavobacterium sp. GT3R68 TaxID=2594437 RepID=UPI000F88F08C|nr:T9SS type A sorting domain-containing protein [Flavobacterium sp. GT3R68]RTY88545.1 T9SS type A sorting domain-containing protein [Flavobacterium sp. GSN2]TRW90578.1 T9SS type A sorting domain-containing protein [Flavobacterium sp. GT3R68]